MYPLVILSLVAFVNAGYDDKLSRTKFFPLAAGAYNDNPEPCIKRTFGDDAQLISKYEVLCDVSDLCFSYIGLSHRDEAIFIGFRGSASTAQLLAEGVDSMLKPHVRAFDVTEVSKYFYNAFNLTWHAGLQKDLLHLSQKYWKYEIWISGHSLGGAIASITATAISHFDPTTEERIKLITYGQPRIGDFAYSLYHELTVPYSYRVTHSHDLVVNLPPLNFLYFWHHKSEIFFDNNMASGSTYKECSSAEDFSCSAGTFGVSIDDHTHYFGVSVSGYGDGNCASNLV